MPVAGGPARVRRCCRANVQPARTHVKIDQKTKLNVPDGCLHAGAIIVPTCGSVRLLFPSPTCSTTPLPCVTSSPRPSPEPTPRPPALSLLVLVARPEVVWNRSVKPRIAYLHIVSRTRRNSTDSVGIGLGSAILHFRVQIRMPRLYHENPAFCVKAYFVPLRTALPVNKSIFL